MVNARLFLVMRMTSHGIESRSRDQKKGFKFLNNDGFQMHIEPCLFSSKEKLLIYCFSSEIKTDQNCVSNRKRIVLGDFPNPTKGMKN